MNTDIIYIDHEICTLCGSCVEICISSVFKKENDSINIIAPINCILCGHCKAICPEDAISLLNFNSNEFEPVPKEQDIPAPEKLQAFFRSRRSIRIFKKKNVEKEKLEKIIEAGRFAPTGGNRQPVEYAIANTPDVINKILTTTIETLVGMANKTNKMIAEIEKGDKALSAKQRIGQFYAERWLKIAELYKSGSDILFYHAPALVIAHVNPSMSVAPGVDAGIAGAQMILMAEALKLGTCFCGFLVLAIEANPDLQGILKIPPGNKTQFTFMAGYPDVSFKRLVSRNPARLTWL